MAEIYIYILNAKSLKKIEYIELLNISLLIMVFITYLQPHQENMGQHEERVAASKQKRAINAAKKAQQQEDAAAAQEAHRQAVFVQKTLERAAAAREALERETPQTTKAAEETYAAFEGVPSGVVQGMEKIESLIGKIQDSIKVMNDNAIVQISDMQAINRILTQIDQMTQILFACHVTKKRLERHIHIHEDVSNELARIFANDEPCMTINIGKFSPNSPIPTQDDRRNDGVPIHDLSSRMRNYYDELSMTVRIVQQEISSYERKFVRLENSFKHTRLEFI